MNKFRFKILKDGTQAIYIGRNRADQKTARAAFKEIYKTDKQQAAQIAAQNKFLNGYQNQIKSGEKRGELNKKRLKDPETGKFLTKALTKAANETAKKTGFENAQDMREKRPDLFALMFEAVSNAEVTLTESLNKIENRIESHAGKFAIEIDGKRTNINQAKLLQMVEQYKQIFAQVNGYTSTSRYYIDANNKLIIKLPNIKELQKFINQNLDADAQDLQEFINDDDIIIITSPPKKSKK